LEGESRHFGTHVEHSFGQIQWLILLRGGKSSGVVGGINWVNSTKGLNSRFSPRLIAENMNSKSGRRHSDTSSSMVSAADMTCPVASPAFLYSLSAKRAIPSGWIVTGFGPAGIKAFRVGSAMMKPLFVYGYYNNLV